MCWKFKKVKPLNNTILLQWRNEAYRRLRFIGRWSGYWETSIGGISYCGDIVSGFKYISGDVGTFIHDALIDRAKLAKEPDKYRKEIEECQHYMAVRFIDEEGNVEQWHHY